MNSRAVEANRSKHVRLQRGSKGQMSANAEPTRAKLSLLNARMLIEVIEHRTTVGVEFRDLCLRRSGQTPRAALIVEWDGRPRGFDPVIDLRRCDYKPIPRQSRCRADHRSGQLEYVRVKQNPRILPFRLRARHECPHRASSDGDV